MDAYHAPYRPKYRYWTGLLLFSRAILYIISAANVSGEPSLNLLAVIIVVTCLLLINAYKKWPLDAFESGFYLNIVIFCTVKFYILQTEGHHTSLTYTSISVSLIIFICIICYHMFTESRCTVTSWLKDKVSKILQPHCYNGERTHLLNNDVQHSSDESSQELTFTNRSH